MAVPSMGKKTEQFQANLLKSVKDMKAGRTAPIDTSRVDSGVP